MIWIPYIIIAIPLVCAVIVFIVSANDPMGGEG